MTEVLLVEDDAKLNKSVKKYLSDRGYAVTGVLDAAAALYEVSGSRYDIIISDIMMPGMDGFELAEKIRESDKNIPILFMTALDDINSKTRGYKLGIDDYIIKPFDLAELDMRICAVLRRVQIESSNRLEVGNLTLDREEHAAYINGDAVLLSVREFDLLYKLLSFPKRTFSRSRIMEEFWGYDSSATSRAVDVFIAELRKKIADCDGFEIATVHGLGYKAVLK